MRACPRCHKPLAAVVEPSALPGQLGGLAGPMVEVDACASCGGRFLDRGEAGRVTGVLGVDVIFTPPRVPHVAGASCPGCGVTMAYREMAGVIIDACPSCGGFWLDPGEIGRLRRALRR